MRTKDVKPAKSKISPGRAKRIERLERLREDFRVLGLNWRESYTVKLSHAEILLLRDACGEERQRLLGR